MGFFNIQPTSSESRIVQAGHYGIHNFSVGALETYFYLSEAKEVHWLEDSILHVKSPQGRYKTWIYNWAKPVDISLIKDYQRLGPVYSQQRLGLPGETKFIETAYDIPTVINPESYSSKTRHKLMLTTLPGWFERQKYKIVPLEDSHKDQLRKLHDEWVEFKMNQPDTYKIMFPARRYERCYQFALKDKNKYLGLVALDENDQASAVNVYYVEGKNAFGLAQFAALWRLHSQFNKNFTTMSFFELNRLGFIYVNDGASLDKNLSAFKHHWPYIQVESWAYSKQERS